MKDGLVSVIVPAYNAEKYIHDTIQSILNQTYDHLEIVVVDDASSDATADIVDSIDDSRIRLIHHDKNLGPGGAKNSGIEEAKGEWLATLDADDQWAPNRVQKMLGYIQSLPKGHFVADNQRLCFNTPNGLSPWIDRFQQMDIQVGDGLHNINLAMFFKMGAPTISPFIPLELIRNNEDVRFTPHCFFGEDLEFYCKLLLNGLKLALYPEPLYLCRLSKGSLSTRSKNDILDVYRRLLSNDKVKNDEARIIENALKKIEANLPFDAFYQAIRDRDWRGAFFQLSHNPKILIPSIQRVPRMLSYYMAARRVEGEMRL